MKLLNKLKNVLPAFWLKLGLAWWVEITTSEPRCTYYFGPFQSSVEAETACPGYVEDLESEQAQGIKININYCKPGVLTVFDEDVYL